MSEDLIRKIPLFSGLDESTIIQISEMSRLKKFEKGSIIFFDSEPYLGFYAVISGLVKIYKISRDGKEHIIHIISPYNTFAEVPLFENYNKITDEDFRYPANTMALEDDTKVLLIPAVPFLELLKSNVKISLRMLSGLAKRLRHLNSHIEDLTLKDVTKRTAGFIVSEFEKLSTQKRKSSYLNETALYPSVKLNISRTDLASYLGTVIETLSRTLGKLQTEGLIEVSGKDIIIINLNKLREISSA